MTSQLSHRGRLPSWNRPGLCRKSGADVRKLAKDQLPSISRSAASGAGEDDEFQAKSKELAKVVQLEKNILFLKQQHHETLGQLHKEIERLRTENRELNFKLVMCCCGGKGRATGHQLFMKEASINISRDDVESSICNDELQGIFLEEEVRELRNRLTIERTKSKRLMKVIEKKVLERQRSYDHSDNESNSDGVQQLIRGGACSSRPAGSRPLCLEDYKMVIKQLETKSNQQAHELLQIKADLRDVLYSHKWTPDAFLMARAYVRNDSTEDKGFLPQIVPQTSRGTLEKAYQRVKEEVTLPALRLKVPSMVAERYRRAQAVRGRVTKSLF